MIKVAMIVRKTLYTVPGGDTIQVTETARALRKMNVEVDVLLTTEKICYERYSLFHFFNVIRPADILVHIRKSAKPYVLSTIFVDYSEYDKKYRSGFVGLMCRMISYSAIEYCKTIARKLGGKDALMSIDYLWRGHKRSVKKILQAASLLLPNSLSEYDRLMKMYRCDTPCVVVPNAFNPELFELTDRNEEDEKLVLCAARIEGLKNQANLIKALTGTDYRLVIAGAAAPNHVSYASYCRKIAGDNIVFTGKIAQHELLWYYARARVHVLPSCFETTGLSSLEAAAMGCNIVITKKGDAEEYFGDEAWYCDPESPSSILAAVQKASEAESNGLLQKRIRSSYTWQRAAEITLQAYQKVVNA